MTKPEALVIFTPAFPKDEQDEYWLPWLQAFIKAVNRNNPHLKIIVFAFQAPDFTREYNWYGNKVFSFNGLNKKRITRLIMWYRILKQFDKIKKDYRIKGIFSMWCHECAFIAKKASKKYNLKHHCWLLGGDAKAANSYVKKINPTGKELVAASDFLKREFYKNHGILPAHVIYHGIDPALFSGIAEPRTIDILGAGNLHASKQYGVFIEIIAALKKEFPGIKVLLCGDGEDREKIMDMVNELELSENVKMVGQVKHAAVLQYMKQSKILLHTSAYEGFGTVCTEALYAGAHVVSFCKPLDKKNPCWYTVENKEEMLIIVKRLLSDVHLRHNNIMVQHIDDTANRALALFD